MKVYLFIFCWAFLSLGGEGRYCVFHPQHVAHNNSLCLQILGRRGGEEEPRITMHASSRGEEKGKGKMKKDTLFSRPRMYFNFKKKK